MAEMKIDIFADLKKLQKQLTTFFKQQFQVNTKAGASGTSGAGQDNKKQTTFLGAIAGIAGKLVPLLGLLAIVGKVVDTLKIVEIVTAFILFGLFTITKWIKGVYDFIVTGLKQYFGAQIETIKWLWGLLSGWFSTLKEWFTSFIKDPIGTLKETIANWIAKIVDKFPIVGKIIEWLKFGWGLITKAFSWISGVISTVANFIGGIIGFVWNWIKTTITKFFADPIGMIKKGVQFVWDLISGLPAKIWEYVKQLPSLISNALKSILPGRSSSVFGGKGTNVNDAVIMKDGKIIKPSSQDNIFLSKSGGSSGASIVNNFYGVTDKKFLEQVKRQLGSDINKVGRY